MIELPEAETLAGQLNETITGKKIASAVAGLSSHKFAWYHGDPKEYDGRLHDRIIGAAAARGGMVEIRAGDVALLFSDGVVLRFHTAGEKRPTKHQLLIEFEDGTAFSASVQMYGGLLCFREGELQNRYYDVAVALPSPLSDKFDRDYFDSLITVPDVQKLSLGNGVLQDILYNAGIHPKRKIATLAEDERAGLFRSIKSTLQEMTEQGGRDVEKDLFGRPGGYATRMSQHSVGKPCPVCGSPVVKQPYLGGSIYFCEGCQKP